MGMYVYLMGRIRYMYLVMSDIILLFATRSCSRSSRRDARLSRTSMSRVSSVETAPQVLVRILRRMSGIDFHVKLVVHQTLLIVGSLLTNLEVRTLSTNVMYDT